MSQLDFKLADEPIQEISKSNIVNLVSLPVIPA